jgi:hypothetical protein
MASDGPIFDKAASHVSDVRFSHVLAPDSKTNSILFDNFVVRLDAGGLPVAARVVSITFPLVGVTAEATAKIEVRGSATLDSGATGTVLFRAFGATQALEPLLDTTDPIPEQPFFKELRFTIPPGSNADITLIVIAERGGNLRGETRVTVDSVDIAIELAEKLDV